MEEQFGEEKVRSIAAECGEFEHVISAMGYGFSMLNVAEGKLIRRCPDCIHWLGGSCAIFRRELSQGEA